MFNVQDENDPNDLELPEERQARETPVQLTTHSTIPEKGQGFRVLMLSIASAAQLEANELRSTDEIEEEHDLLTMWEEDAPDEPQATG